MSLFDDLPEPSVDSDESNNLEQSDDTPSVSGIKSGSCVELFPIIYSVISRKGERPEMQDAHILMDDLMQLMCRGVSSEIGRVGFFGVFDGHGGSRASNFACKRLHQHIAARFPRGGIQQVEKDIKRVLYDSYKKTDEEFLREACQQRPHWRDGSTAATVLLVNNTLYIANLGDSKVVLARFVETPSPSESNHSNGNANNTDKSPVKNTKLSAICLTKDHNPMDYEERQRIQATGASVQNGRVNSILEVSRSFGDYQFKKQGVTCIPDVRKCQLTNDDQFLLIACDGLWKSFPPNEAVCLTHQLLMKEIENYKKEHLNSQNGQSSTLKLSEILSQRHLDSVCTHLVNEAVLRMSGDNVTCILLVFPTIFIEKNSLNNDDHHSKISSVSNNDKDNDDDGDDDDDNDNKTSEPSSKLPRIEK